MNCVFLSYMSVAGVHWNEAISQQFDYCMCAFLMLVIGNECNH